MAFPSIKMIRDRLAVDQDKARRIRGLMDGTRKTRTYASVRETERRCFNRLSRIERALIALDEELGTYGVEPIRDDRRCNSYLGDVVAEYLNAGDAYDVTIIYDHVRGLWQIMDYGTWLERYERRHGAVA